FALELGRELVRTGTRPTAGQALRVPDSLRELLGERLARLPGETLDVLLQTAALARPTVELVAAAHGDRTRVLRALEAATHEGVVELDDSRIRFSHPLLASICYEEAPIWKRRAVHQSLAGVVSDVEERARHRALAVERPDPEVASELDAAAEQAAVRGATAAAAELSELAAELTQDDRSLQQRRRLRAANFYRLAGNTDRAVAMLEELRDDVPPGPMRADVLFALAVTFALDTGTNLEFCREALDDAAGDDVRSARILALQGGLHLFGGDVQAALADSKGALEKAERVGDLSLLADAIARVGIAELRTSKFTRGLLERGVEIEERLGHRLEYYASPTYTLARLRLRLGEIDGPRVVLEKLEADAAARGDEGTRGQVLWVLTMLEWLAGHWRRASELAGTAYELAEQTQHPHGRMWVGRMKALLEADLGLVEQARASVDECLAYTSATTADFYPIVSLGTLGRLELALGNVESAADLLRDLPERLLASGTSDPTLPAWADAIEALTAHGELDRARHHLQTYEEHGHALGSPWAIAAAARCRGLVLGAEGDSEGAQQALDDALAELDRHPYPLELGRTLLCLGTVRRRAQQRADARDALERALATFEDLGAELWAKTARAELRRVSGRRPPSDELTVTERRVAELAAQGRTNREIAAELFMGVSTVEAHLSRVYRKLEVRRAGLAAALSETRDGTAKAMDEAAQV
ncbi:MAG TPA: LuxR C-terminal-related transcriptional regulator, partial [Gaiellaceae bacterium]|nr:LuxR C-terminal-related transcriptional regulator [Gaiellaceae bacterium]